MFRTLAFALIMTMCAAGAVAAAALKVGFSADYPPLIFEEGGRESVGKFPPGLSTGPRVGSLEAVENLSQGSIQKLRRANRRAFRTNPPNPAMRLVPARVAIGVVLMASNRIIPVHDINGTVGTDVHVNGTEIAVGRA